MNRFRIALGFETGFEDLWRKRDSYLSDVDGFQEFHLLRGLTTDECTLFASHTVWETKEQFETWTHSDAFRQAHGQAKAPPGTYLGHPEFEGFDVVL